MKPSFKELQKLCYIHKDQLPPGTRCGGKGITRLVLERILTEAGLLPEAGRATEGRTTEGRTTEGRGEETSSVAAPITATKKAKRKTEEVLVPQYEPSRSVITNFTSSVEVVAALGSGGFGDVMKVKLRDNGEVRYALKTSITKERRRLRAFLTEAAHLVRLDHPNIAQIVGIESHPKLGYILFRLYDMDLRNLLHTKRLEPQEMVKYAYDIVAGVAYMHSRNVIHLDLKPANILYDKEQDRLVIADLGLSESLFCVTGDNPTTRIIGTRVYRAPEIMLFRYMEHPTHGTATDVWSVGLILMELSGQPRLLHLERDVEKETGEREFVKQLEAVLGPIDRRLWPKLPFISAPPASEDKLEEIRAATRPEGLFSMARAMLHYDPRDRISLSTALQDALFDEVRTAAQDSKEISCLDNLYLRGLQRSESPFEWMDAQRNQTPSNAPKRSKLTHVDLNLMWDGLICGALNIGLPDKVLYLARHLMDEGMDEGVTTKNRLAVHGLACMSLAELMTDTSAASEARKIRLFQQYYKKDAIVRQMVRVVNNITADVAVSPADKFIAEYVQLHYEDEKDLLVPLARRIGLLYLYAENYYRLSAYQIALFSLFFATRALSLPFRLSSLVEEIWPPTLSASPATSEILFRDIKSPVKGNDAILHIFTL